MATEGVRVYADDCVVPLSSGGFDKEAPATSVAALGSEAAARAAAGSRGVEVFAMAVVC